MKPVVLDFLQAAVTGVVGAGRGGIVSRCFECPWTRLDLGPCGGFGEGCLTRPPAPSARVGAIPDEPVR